MRNGAPDPTIPTGSVAPAPPWLDRVVLIGFMASGKSTVGAALAELWGWRFIDFDVEIEHRAGCTVAEFFARFGEAEFRAAEAALTAEVAELTQAILAPGGGWITQPELVEHLDDRSLLVWLRIGAEEAVRRSRSAPHHRPLLAGPDPLGKARAIIADREPLYAMADLVVDVEDAGGDPVAVAREIALRVNEI